MTDQKFAYVAFSSNQAITYGRYKLIKSKFSNLNDFLDLSFEDQKKFLNLQNDKQKALFENMKKNALQILNVCQRKEISIVTLEDKDYPNAFRNIENPPHTLYMLGKRKLPSVKIGIIGTRKPTRDAIDLNRNFSKVLSRAGIAIISGMAMGHDSIALQQAIEDDGFPVAILGNAIDKAYPAINRSLYFQILQKGLILSEYPPGFSTQRWNFVLRNRLISALSDILLVVQAPLKSGTMSTVRYAELQQKEVYVVPGSPLLKENEGTNHLIEQGCKIATSPELLLENLVNDSFAGKLKIDLKEEKEEENLPVLDKNESIIYHLLQTELNIDEIVMLSNFEVAKLNSLLMQMELKEVIEQLPGRFYRRVNK